MLFSLCYLLLLAILAGQMQSRVRLFETFQGLPRYLTALGLTLFLAAWVDFITYVIFGWGLPYRAICWIALGGTTFMACRRKLSRKAVRENRIQLRNSLLSFRHWNYAFLFLATLVLTRFCNGLEEINGEIWSNFNFVDSAFHLSVINAFKVAPHFPPMDLDMAPYPLKYHFLADFFVAHLNQLGFPRVLALRVMNVISAAAMVGAVWATFERWLKLSARWILLGGVIFLFLNTSLVNVIHYLTFHPIFFHPTHPFDGLFNFPFFNFESMLYNLLEPQRGFLFTLPVVLLILHAVFGDDEARETETTEEGLVRRRQSLLWASGLICLLPLSHIIAFVVLGAAVVPALWQERTWLLQRWRFWCVPLALGLLQIYYLRFYGPPLNSAYATRLTEELLPAPELAGTSAWIRRTVFWFFADGDFLAWGLVFTVAAAISRGPLWRFVVRWRWYFVACTAFFFLINFFAFMFCWGDSNKFVLFLNLGLTCAIVFGSSRWIGRPGAWRSHVLWTFFFLLSVVPHLYEFYRDIYTLPDGKVLLFQHNGQAAARWLRHSTRPTDVVLTAAYDISHFVTPLGGRPVMAGLYGNTDMYRQDQRDEAIRRVYEDGAFGLVRQLGVRYVCISRSERRDYKINPRWITFMETSKAVAFHSGRTDEFDSVFIFDATALPLN